MENDFIKAYLNVFPDGFCDHIISEFERLRSNGICGNRQKSENCKKVEKEDHFYSINIKNHLISDFNDQSTLSIFFNNLQNCFDDYVNQFDILKDFNLKCTSVKIQKTDPGAGYHVWHFEQGPDSEASRCLVYIAYLNDIDSAGETEFLYQKLRIPPIKNTVLIWPAAFTHTHRGNVVYGNKSKYIITGWFYFD